MLRIFLIALQLVLISSLNAQDGTTNEKATGLPQNTDGKTRGLPGYATAISYPSEEELRREKAMEKCRKNSARTGEHSYFATLKIHRSFQFLKFVQKIDGIMISSNYFLAYGTLKPLREEGCNYTVHIESDDAEYEADVIEDGKIKLFKLKDPLKKDSKAKPVKMIEAGEGPQPGTQATLVERIYDKKNDKHLIILANATVMSEQDCTKFKMDTEFRWLGRCDDGFLYVNYTQPSCDYDKAGALFVNGELAGIVHEGVAPLQRINLTLRELYNEARNTIQWLAPLNTSRMYLRHIFSTARDRSTIHRLTGI